MAIPMAHSPKKGDFHFDFMESPYLFSIFTWRQRHITKSTADLFAKTKISVHFFFWLLVRAFVFVPIFSFWKGAINRRTLLATQPLRSGLRSGRPTSRPPGESFGRRNDGHQRTRPCAIRNCAAHLRRRHLNLTLDSSVEDPCSGPIACLTWPVFFRAARPRKNKKNERFIMKLGWRFSLNYPDQIVGGFVLG